ncbi:hypothetical protein WOSG25_110240 [Weissella oryzae SG25]|uniref:Uncharacterized protein n=1 Tax=Weissella oryzae (strain DSM 25784 / JCM 18191 / LMG 30913 / SG25) TaxID=1329250 RepID=A0A069D2A7_WEIOS|nr:hypothetical protein [Weissella oryzae]GAK31546.1 hypothetical protein WOSG25_110240 [Weissella oryzae SG25]
MSFKTNPNKTPGSPSSTKKQAPNTEAKALKKPGAMKKIVAGLASPELKNFQKPSDIRKQAQADLQAKFNETAEETAKYKSVINPKLYTYLLIAILIFIVLVLIMMIFNR